MQEISFDRVVQIWEAAGGKDTLGILEAFRPPMTVRWQEGTIAAVEAGDLRFIGGVPGDRYIEISRGTYRVRDAVGNAGFRPGFQWNPAWRIIALRDPERSERVIIDGNERACRLYRAVEEGEVSRDERVGIIVGDLAQGLVFRAKAIAPLWR